MLEVNLSSARRSAGTPRCRRRAAGARGRTSSASPLRPPRPPRRPTRRARARRRLAAARSVAARTRPRARVHRGRERSEALDLHHRRPTGPGFLVLGRSVDVEERLQPRVCRGELGVGEQGGLVQRQHATPLEQRLRAERAGCRGVRRRAGPGSCGRRRRAAGHGPAPPAAPPRAPRPPGPPAPRGGRKRDASAAGRRRRPPPPPRARPRRPDPSRCPATARGRPPGRPRPARAAAGWAAPAPAPAPRGRARRPPGRPLPPFGAAVSIRATPALPWRCPSVPSGRRRGRCRPRVGYCRSPRWLYATVEVANQSGRGNRRHHPHRTAEADGRVPHVGRGAGPPDERGPNERGPG